MMTISILLIISLSVKYYKEYLMYRCDVCGKVTQPSESCKVIISKKREKNYRFRPGVNRVKREDGKWEYTNDNGGEGTEISKELKVCSKCAPQYKDKLLAK